MSQQGFQVDCVPFAVCNSTLLLPTSTCNSSTPGLQSDVPKLSAAEAVPLLGSLLPVELPSKQILQCRAC